MPDLGEWTMLMRGPRGQEYAIASGHLPVTMLPHHKDDGRVVLTVEIAQFVRALGDKIERLCIQGEAVATYTLPEGHSSTPPDTTLQ